MHTVMSPFVDELPMDRSLFQHLNSVAKATPWLHAAFRAYAEYGVVLFAVLLLWSWWTARGGRDLVAVSAALWAPVGTLLAVGLNQPLGNWVREPRPYISLQHVEVLVSRSSDFSFPSDHAVMAGAVTVGVWLVNRRQGLLAAAAAALMAFTRVYVGAHYPSDVVAGLLLGGGVALMSYLLARRVLEPLVARLADSPASVVTSAHPASRVSRSATESTR